MSGISELASREDDGSNKGIGGNRIIEKLLEDSLKKTTDSPIPMNRCETK